LHALEYETLYSECVLVLFTVA